MNRQIFRFLTAAGLSLTLALGAVTATASPARADNSDAVRLLGGLIALYAIGQALQAGAETHQPRHVERPRARNHRVAPTRCFIQGTDRNGAYRGYRSRCMERHVSRPALLPRECLRRVQTDQGRRVIYGGRCLAQNGWVREDRVRH